MELIENIIEIMKIKEITPYKMEKDIGHSDCCNDVWLGKNR